MLALDFLGVPFARTMHCGFEMAFVRAESGKRDYSRPLLSEPDVKVSLHPAQASQRPCEGPVSSKRPAGCTILDSSRCPCGEGSTSGTSHRHLQHLLYRFLRGSRAETPQGS